MAEEKDWHQQLLGAALMAAARTAAEYVTNPDARDETVKDVRSRLAEVDYSAVARALTKAIDGLADSSKSAVNEAIDSLKENAEDAVEAAAGKAQEQLGKPKKGRGKLFFGVLLGVALGFFLLNEDRRNQIMDKLTGASGPIDTTQWNTVSSTVQEKASDVANTASEATQQTAAEETPKSTAKPKAAGKSETAKTDSTPGEGGQAAEPSS